LGLFTIAFQRIFIITRLQIVQHPLRITLCLILQIHDTSIPIILEPSLLVSDTERREAGGSGLDYRRVVLHRVSGETVSVGYSLIYFCVGGTGMSNGLETHRTL
jgi:hypothetical protein